MDFFVLEGANSYVPHEVESCELSEGITNANKGKWNRDRGGWGH